MSPPPVLPFTGAMIHYGYLWHEQARRGQVVPSKERPCLVVAVLPRSRTEGASEAARIAYVMPVTTRTPADPSRALVLPASLVRRCGLDVERRPMLVCDEINRFEWRGPDVVGTPDGRSHYGAVGQSVVRAALDRFGADGAGKLGKITPRSP